MGEPAGRGAILRWAGSRRRWFLPSRIGWAAISAPSSKMRTSLGWLCTSTTRFLVASGTE